MPTLGARGRIKSPVNPWSRMGRRAGSSEECWDMGHRRKDTEVKKENCPL